MKAAAFTFDEYQQLARRTRKNCPSMHWAGEGMAAEAGEVCGETKKDFEGVGGPSIDNIVKECGDVLWYIALMADALDISLAEIAEGNIKKLEERHLKSVRPTPPERPSAKAAAKKRGTKRKVAK